MFLALRESLFLEKVMKDILWRELQTLKYGFLINDTIELLLIILGMILWFCRRMPLFLGYVCCSLLRWITMSANYFKHMWIGLAHIKSLFSWVKNKGRPMPVVQPNSCWKREREKANEVTVGVPDEEYKNICSVLSNFYVFEVFQN